MKWERDLLMHHVILLLFSTTSFSPTNLLTELFLEMGLLVFQKNSITVFIINPKPCHSHNRELTKNIRAFSFNLSLTLVIQARRKNWLNLSLLCQLPHLKRLIFAGNRGDGKGYPPPNTKMIHFIGRSNRFKGQK